MPGSEDRSQHPQQLAAKSVASRANVSLGVEKLGLLAMRAPLVAIALALLIAGLAAIGMQKINGDDSLSDLFRANTPAFKQFEEESRQFPSNEYDILVVVEGKSLLARESIERLRTLATDLQLVEGARGIVSLFSARRPSAENGSPEPIFPEQLPAGPEYDSLVAALERNDLIRGKLLSDDGSLTLMILSLDPAATANGNLNKVVTDIREVLAEDLKGAGLTSAISGVPVMQLEIRTAIARDRLLYNAIGFMIGCGLAFLFFRRASFLIVAAGPPLFAILFALGLVGWLGFRLNVFLNVMTPLVMVISFSDSMQLTFAARDQLIRGRDRMTAFREAIRTVGPACVLTHATAGLSFLALLVSESELIRAFGEAGFLSVVIALVTVLTLVPALGLVLAPTPASLSKFKDRDGGVDSLRRFCDWMAGRMTNRPGLHSLGALVVVAVLGLGYIGLQPRYSLADQVPDRERALQAINRLDAKLTGANPIDVLVEFPEGDDIFTPRALETIADVHRLVETQAGVGNVWSPESLRRWLAQTLGKTDIATLKEYVDLLPQYLVRRFVSEKRTAAIVSGRVPDKESSDLLPVVDHLDGALNAVRDRHPGFTISVTGLAVIAARNSANMIGKLNRGLTIEFLFVAAFIGLAFRSASVAFATILTGIFPVVAAAALLRALGDGLQFASVVALTVSFGLGLSATIHFLNRLWPEMSSDEDPARAVKRATVMMGPPLLLTAGVLICGLAATSFSALPALRLFGWLSAFAMLAAVVADLTILRPVITYLLRRQHDARARRALEATSPPTVGV